MRSTVLRRGHNMLKMKPPPYGWLKRAGEGTVVGSREQIPGSSWRWYCRPIYHDSRITLPDILSDSSKRCRRIPPFSLFMLPTHPLPLDIFLGIDRTPFQDWAVLSQGSQQGQSWTLTAMLYPPCQQSPWQKKIFQSTVGRAFIPFSFGAGEQNFLSGFSRRGGQPSSASFRSNWSRMTLGRGRNCIADYQPLFGQFGFYQQGCRSVRG